MEQNLNKLSASLKAGGYSLTVPRKAVFQALHDTEPLTMADLAKRVGKTVDRASIYRVVALFEQLGIADRLQIGWKYKIELSDTFSSHHHHMTCTNCGLVKAFEESTVIEFELKQLAQDAGFVATGHQLEIRGLCEQCRTK